jgi:hypothetical protein
LACGGFSNDPGICIQKFGKMMEEEVREKMMAASTSNLPARKWLT